MIFTYIKIENFKSFRNVSINLDAQITCLIGLNGAGKSNVLSAIELILKHNLNYAEFLEYRNIAYLNQDTHIKLGILCSNEEYLKLSKGLGEKIKFKKVGHFSEVQLCLSFYAKNKKLERYFINENLKKILFLNDKHEGLAIKLLSYLKEIIKNKVLYENNEYNGYLIAEVSDLFLFDLEYIKKLNAIIEKITEQEVAETLKSVDSIKKLYILIFKSLLNESKHLEDNNIMKVFFENTIYNNFILSSISKNNDTYNNLSFYGIKEAVNFNSLKVDVAAKINISDLAMHQNSISNKFPLFYSLADLAGAWNILGEKDILSANKIKKIIDIINNWFKSKETKLKQVLFYEIVQNTILLRAKFANTNNDISANYCSSGTKDLIIYRILLTKYFQNRLIIIDEPDSKLHIANQNELISIFNESIKLGNKIVFTTHSPFMVSCNLASSTILIEESDGQSYCLFIQNILNSMENSSLKPLLEKNNTGISPFLFKLGYRNIEKIFFDYKNYLIVEGKTDLIAINIIDFLLKSNISEMFEIKYLNGVLKIDEMLQGEEEYYRNITLMVDNDDKSIEYTKKYRKQLKNVIYVYNSEFRNLDEVFKISPLFKELWDKYYPIQKFKIPIYNMFFSQIRLIEEEKFSDVIPDKLIAILKDIKDNLLSVFKKG